MGIVMRERQYLWLLSKQDSNREASGKEKAVGKDTEEENKGCAV